MPDQASVAGGAAAPRSLDIQEIRRLLPHRYPMLLVDRVDRLEPGVAIEAVKCVTANEPFLVGHFPDFPVMPGVLIVDALAQAAGIMLRADAPTRPQAVEAAAAGPAAVPAPPPAAAGQPGMLASIPRMRFLRPVVPGDRLLLAVRLVKSFGSTHKVTVEATVDGETVAAGELVLASGGRG